MADEENGAGKAHRPKHSGPKADKKKKKNEGKEDKTESRRNAKAFTFHSVVKAARQFRRSKDIETKKHHVPVVDRTPLEPPPVIVAIVGPPKVGKTTLINSLLKNFTRQNLSNIEGPVTLVSGKPSY
jgi:ribosome biogenesis protein BMS1